MHNDNSLLTVRLEKMEKSPQDRLDFIHRPLTPTGGSTPSLTRRDRMVFRIFRRVFVALCLCIALYLFISWPGISTTKLLPCLHLPGYLGINRNAGYNDAAASTHGVSYTTEATGHLYDGQEGGRKLSSNNKVPLEVHIMSKCPDARDCLQQLVVPAMEKVDDIVDFKLSFIAR